jgi:DNA-binding GntR family transcriptional regulator
MYGLADRLGTAQAEYGTRSPQYALAHLDLHTAINDAAFTRARVLALAGSPGHYQTDDYVQQEGYEPVRQHRLLIDALSSGAEDRAVTAVYAHAMRGRPSAMRDDMAEARPAADTEAGA